MTELIEIRTRDHIADVRFNRPEKLNALNHAMFEAIADTLDALDHAAATRAVVISGAGDAFCAGLDFENFKAMQSDGGAFSEKLTHRYGDRIVNLYQYVCYGWRQLPMPVIAAIHGVAFGGGCQIALGADIRLARPDARFSLMEIKWGLIPDMSVSQTIREVLPMDVAKELMFTGKIVDGQAADKLGLVTRTCEDPYREAMSLAGEIASKSPHAVRAAKQLLNETRYGDATAGLLMESELQETLIGSPNQVEAVRANLEKRAPRYEDI